MNVQLKNYQLNVLDSKNKFYSTVSNLLTRAFFKIESGNFSFMLRGSKGMSKTNIPIDYDGDTIYFSVDFAKWQTSLQKFSFSDSIDISVKDSILTISTSSSPDKINLGIVKYDADSSEASVIDNYLTSKKKEIISDNKSITLTDELISNLHLTDNLFSTQNRVNSVALFKDSVMYSDRSVVVKIALENPLADELFEDMNEDESCIYLHSNFLKLFNIFKKTNDTVYFSSDFEQIYWADDDTEISIETEPHQVAIPSEEQFESIKPQDKSLNFVSTLKNIKSSIDFFNGFFEGSAWKPLTFNVEKGNGVVLTYRRPTTELTKSIDAEAFGDGNFVIDSETMKKIVSCICERYPEDTTNITIYFDEEGPGIYCVVSDIYEILLSKLQGED